jgi:N6-L-threonylcarbamoyladenine synthase
MNEAINNAAVYILAIETSCDETSVAIVRNGSEVLSNFVSSQIDIHREYGGVVPEVASRKHVEVITLLIEQALAEAGVEKNQLSAIAVTYGPGLIGSLLVGIAAAKTLSFILGIPLIGVHHIAGHIYANHLKQSLAFPLVALIVSGGHTELIYMRDHLSFELLGETQDDAVGEAYDKVARVLDLPYPGGPNIDRLAAKGEANIPLPKARMNNPFDFSFSGLKSAVINVVHNAKQRGETIIPENLAASFQKAVVDTLLEKALLALKEKKANNLIVAGGVAANSGLRAALKTESERLGFNLTIPQLDLCTDNAAMIGSVAYYYYLNQNWSELDINGIANLALAEESISEIDKATLRKNYLVRRDQISGAERARQAELISRKIIASEWFKQTGVVALYAAHGSEVDLAAVMAAGTAAGKRMLLPRVESVEKRLVFWPVEQGEELVAGHYGIGEPSISGKSPLTIKEIDVILVPGLVFDKQGNRIGYGGGYYDRFLGEKHRASKRQKRPLTVGIGYNEQIVEKLPIVVEEHDVALDIILTEGTEYNVTGK